VHCAKLREVDTTPLLDAALALRHAEVYVPIVDHPGGDDAAPSMRFLRVRSLARDLEPKTMGILEPKEFLDDGVTPRENLEDAGFDPPLDVLLMPGLAFETSGARLGRGGGFYDAFLERYRRGCRRAGANTPPTLALAFAPQVLAPGAVPAAAHDQPVDALATPGGIVACTNAGRRLVEGG
jgi:5-formyltetrahydrofolate cyclo-ligase